MVGQIVTYFHGTDLISLRGIRRRGLLAFAPNTAISASLSFSEAAEYALNWDKKRAAVLRLSELPKGSRVRRDRALSIVDISGKSVLIDKCSAPIRPTYYCRVRYKGTGYGISKWIEV